MPSSRPDPPTHGQKRIEADSARLSINLRHAIRILLALVILVTVAFVVGSVDAVSTGSSAPTIDIKKPAFIVTSMSGLAKVLQKGEAAKIITLADRYGDIYDIDEILSSEYAATRSAILADPKKYIATVDEIIKKKFSTSRYSCIFILGGQDVVPMAELPNPVLLRLDPKSGQFMDKDTLYTDDVYGDFDGDTVPDVPVARLPDGKSFATMKGQLRGTSAPPSGAMELYNKPWTGAKAIGLQINAGRIDSVPPTEDAKLDANLKYYYFIIHGSKDQGVWAGDGKARGGWPIRVVGLLAQDAAARGIVVSSACYAGYMINETSATDIGLHFIESGARAYIGATGINYAYPGQDPQAFLGNFCGRMASLIFQNCELGQDPLLAYFNAKREFARGFAAGDSVSHKILHETNYFGLPFTAASSAGTPPAKPGPSASTGESDTELVMDVSGSMGDEMSGSVKLDAAKSAADGIVTMIRDQSLTQSGSSAIGLVSFSNEAQVVQPLGADYAAASEAIAAMTPQSGTNVGDGLEKALGSLYGSAKTRSRMMILLSDGQSNTGMSADEILSGPVFTATAAGIKIYTVGFGDPGDIDEDLLRQIANRTGGVYYYADQAFKLENIYIALQHKAGGAILGDYTGTTQAAAQQVGAFSVDAVTGELHGTLNSEGGKAHVVLKDPDGRAIDSDYPGAILFKDSKPASVVVKNPQPGVWKAYVESAGGSKITYDVIVSARGTRAPVNTYRTLLALVALGATVLALGFVSVFRWPIRSPRN